MPDWNPALSISLSLSLTDTLTVGILIRVIFTLLLIKIRGSWKSWCKWVWIHVVPYPTSLFPTAQRKSLDFCTLPSSFFRLPGRSFFCMTIIQPSGVPFPPTTRGNLDSVVFNLSIHFGGFQPCQKYCSTADDKACFTYHTETAATYSSFFFSWKGLGTPMVRVIRVLMERDC